MLIVWHCIRLGTICMRDKQGFEVNMNWKAWIDTHDWKALIKKCRNYHGIYLWLFIKMYLINKVGNGINNENDHDSWAMIFLYEEKHTFTMMMKLMTTGWLHDTIVRRWHFALEWLHSIKCTRCKSYNKCHNWNTSVLSHGFIMMGASLGKHGGIWKNVMHESKHTYMYMCMRVKAWYFGENIRHIAC